MLVAELDCWFAGMSTAVSKATAAYPASISNFHWGGCVASIAGTPFDVTKLSIETDLGYNLDRQQIRGNTDNKEPTPGAISPTFSLEADFKDLSQYNRVHTAVKANIMATLSAVWTNGTSSLTVSMPFARFDDFEFGGDPGALTQQLSGIGEADTGTSPVTLVYVTTDTTP